jgi:pentatricopeptide repeat protein
MIAQFFCELADRARQHGARAEARDYLRQAFECQPDCVRAFMLTGRLQSEDDRHADAVAAYEAAVNADIAFTPEILPPLLNSYARSQQMDRAESFLREMLSRYHGISPVLA